MSKSAAFFIPVCFTSDIISNGTYFSISNFTASVSGTVLANPSDNTILLTITNITSVHSGDYEKHLWWHDDEPPLLHRDANNPSNQPYTNTSQTFRLKIGYNETVQKLLFSNILKHAGEK